MTETIPVEDTAPIMIPRRPRGSLTKLVRHERKEAERLKEGQVLSKITSYGEFRCKLLSVGSRESLVKVIAGPPDSVGRETRLANWLLIDYAVEVEG